MKCPNCSGHIGRFELASECKHCGVNIFYSQQKDLLTRDAKMCELEYAGFRILVAKLKASFIKGIIPIMRIVAMIVAIGSIFVPFAKVTADLPLINAEFSFGAWGIYSAFSDGTLGAVAGLCEYAPGQGYFMLALLGLIMLIFMAGLGVFVTLLLSFINIRKTAGIMCGFSVGGVFFCLCAAVISVIMPSALAECGFLSGQTGVGAFGCLAVFVLIFTLNYLVIKKNIQPHIKEVDLQRVAMKKRIKSGEVSIDDLSLPVFESDEERKKRLEDAEKSHQLIVEAKGGDSLE